jgi:signal transduction histidine kinase
MDAQQAFRLLEKSEKQRDAKAYVQAELALTFAKLGKLKKAYEWAQSAYHLYNEIPLLKRYVSVYQTITETFRLTGNFQSAFQSEHETRMLQDSLFEWRKLQTIEEMRLKYETDIKDKEIANLNLESTLQRSLLIRNKTALYILAISLFILAGTGIIYNRKREKYHGKIRGLESSQQVRIEKERIAKELHDSLGSQLSTISLGIQRAAYETGNETLLSVQAMVDKAMAELRDSIWAMNKEFISLEELEQRINTLFWQYRKIDIPIEMELKVEGELVEKKLSPDTGAHLYRIVQEAVQNAVKHSEASRLLISLHCVDAHLELIIEDNGKGFTWPAKNSEEHFGLKNMKNRAALLHAEFTMGATPNGGTHIKINVPLAR